MTKLTEAQYVVENDKLKIFMTLNFKKNTFDLQTKDSKYDFVFLDSSPEYAQKVISLMAEASATALKLLKQHKDAKCSVDYV